MNVIAKKDEKEESVTWIDQQQINRFASLNTSKTAIKDALDSRNQEKEFISDLLDELDLLDDDELVLYKTGGSFIELSVAEARIKAEQFKQSIQQGLDLDLESNSKIELEMNDLKVNLYKKFGNSINLEL